VEFHDQATLSFLLSAACHELFPNRILFIEHSLSDGYYCHFGSGSRIEEKEKNLISKKMDEYLYGDIEIKLEETPKQELINTFKSENRRDKLALLEIWQVDPVPTIRFGDFLDYRFEPMTTNKAILGSKELRLYDIGFLLRFSKTIGRKRVDSFVDAPKLYKIIQEHETWGKILGVSNIGELNELIKTGEIDEMIWVAEGLHEKKISQIADSLCGESKEKRVILIAGPSASGKTKFSKRLGIQLKVNGYSTLPISMDDYYLNREEIPDGKFENINSLNVDLLSEHLDCLLNGKAIPERKFEFASGKGYYTGNKIEVSPDMLIVLEGIHGLNPVFANRIGINRLQQIYVSALTQLNVDNEHRVSTADNRLLRRLVRDEMYRGYSADDVLSQWKHVRSGEEENIFPYQEEADYLFNSSLVFEIPVLATQALPHLEEIQRSSENYQTAQRLLMFLSFFIQISPEHIPETSILREFIGSNRDNRRVR